MPAKTRYFRVAREGETIDGREITKNHINEMASNYDLEFYGARIWLEHYRSLMPDGAFQALGDVKSLKAEDDKSGKRVLLASLDPTDKLLSMNKDRQKIYSSIEMQPMKEKGGMYLTGLAVTDSPASTGTEILKFSLQNKDQFSDKVKLPQQMFSEYIETDFNFSEDPQEWLLSVLDMFSKGNKNTDEQIEKMCSAITEIAESQSKLLNQVNSLISNADSKSKYISEQTFNALKSQFDSLLKDLESTPSGNYRARPNNTGGGTEQIDC